MNGKSILAVAASLALASSLSAQLRTAPLPRPAATSASASAPRGTTPARQLVRVTHALVTPLQNGEVHVPAREAGALTAVHVGEGRAVLAGALLGQVDDADARVKRLIAELEHAGARKTAESEAELKAARKTAEVAKAEAEQSETINRRNPGTVTETELRRLRLTYERSLAQIDVAAMEKDVAGITAQVKAGQVQAIDNELARRQLLSPIDGVVVDVQKDVGEWCQPGDVVLKIVRMDKLRVQGFVNAAEVTPDEILYRPVTVTVNLARGKTKKVPGIIEFVSPVIEASGEFRVWTVVENELIDNRHWTVRPGATAEMEIDLSAPPVTPSQVEMPLAPALPVSPVVGEGAVGEAPADEPPALDGFRPRTVNKPELEAAPPKLPPQEEPTPPRNEVTESASPRTEPAPQRSVAPQAPRSSPPRLPSVSGQKSSSGFSIDALPPQKKASPVPKKADPET